MTDATHSRPELPSRRAYLLGLAKPVALIGAGVVLTFWLWARLDLENSLFGFLDVVELAIGPALIAFGWRDLANERRVRRELERQSSSRRGPRLSADGRASLKPSDPQETPIESSTTE